jgi:hypothetical protein
LSFKLGIVSNGFEGIGIVIDSSVSADLTTRDDGLICLLPFGVKTLMLLRGKKQEEEDGRE